MSQYLPEVHTHHDARHRGGVVNTVRSPSRARPRLAACIILLPAATGCFVPAAHGATIAFINEFHYDNAGSDVGEGVEIAGLAGLDLAGWSLVFYNGSNGAVYADTALSGQLPDEGDGSGALFFDQPGLQNGPDALALVTPDAMVIEFLSYEGVFTATDGPATGLTSTDVGVAQGNGDAPGLSLQRVGIGSSPGDFTWVAGATASYGRLNEGQTLTAAVPLPGGLALLAPALGGLAGRVRRKAERGVRGEAMLREPT